MKKIILSIMATLLLVAGCANIQLNNSQLLIAEIAAQRVGYYVAANNPEMTNYAKLIAEGILMNTEQDALRDALVFGLVQLAETKTNDPLLAADLKLIMQHLQLDIPESKIEIEQVKVLVAAFIRGMDVATTPR